MTIFPMDARDFIKIGMSAERTLVVPPERTVGHFVPDMPSCSRRAPRDPL
jgi:hypothetical protein